MDLQEVRKRVLFIKKAAAYDPIVEKVAFLKRAATTLALPAASTTAKAVGGGSKFLSGAGKFLSGVSSHVMPVVGGAVQGIDAATNLYNAGSQFSHGNILKGTSNLAAAGLNGLGAASQLGGPELSIPVQIGTMMGAGLLNAGPAQANSVARVGGARHNTPSGLIEYNPMATQ